MAGNDIAGVWNLVRGWIRETKERGFRINVLSPSHTLMPDLPTFVPEQRKC